MSPNILNAPAPGDADHIMYDADGPHENEMEREAWRNSAQEQPQDEEEQEHNPWRNHSDDAHPWLGLLLAAVGAGAIGYLIAGA